MTTYTPAQLTNLLTNLPRGVKIELKRNRRGELTVDNPPTKASIIAKKYGALVGNPITVTEAAKKYDVHRDTILKWKNKGYIAVLTPGYRMELDEADVAYCAAILHERKKRGIGFRAPLLNDDGLPYRLKHPELSAYRKRRREANTPE